MTRTFDFGGSVVVTSEISGQTVIARNSGQTISIGNVPTVIAQNSGQTVHFASGFNNIQTAGTTIQITSLVQITSLSGGVQLGAVNTTNGLVVKNNSGNGAMYVGGIGSNAPFSGKGYMLLSNEATPVLQVNSASGVRVFAVTSGQFVSWIGVT